MRGRSLNASARRL